MNLEPENNPTAESPSQSSASAKAVPPSKLSSDEARQLVEHLAVVTKSGLPIAPALRAAAAELPHERLAAAMSRLATDLEMGRSLEEILRNNPRFLPPHIQRLIETGVQSGNLPEVLVQLVEIDRSSADLRRSVRLAVAYPLVLFTLFIVLVAMFVSYVLPGLMQVFGDFHIQLPLPTRMLTWIAHPWTVRVVVFLFAAISMIILGFRIVRRPFAWQRLVVDTPLVGPTLLWRGLANWCRLLALLVRQQIPLPEAVRLAANSVAAPIVTVAALRAARSVESGRKLAEGLGAVRALPASLVPMVRWGETQGALPQALDSAADFFEQRVNLRAALLQSVLPPITFIVVAIGALWLVNAMISPLLGLIVGLSKGGMKGNQFAVRDTEREMVIIAGVIAGVWLAMTVIVWLYYSAVGTLFAALAAGADDYQSEGRRMLLTLFKFLYWAATLIFLFVIMVGLGGWLGLGLWVVTVIIVIMVFHRYREAEYRSLMSLLAVAMEKRIPLPEAIGALGAERKDRNGRRFRRLAGYVHDGVPLEGALARSRIRLSTDALLAVREKPTGTAQAALMRAAVRGAGPLDVARHAAMGRLIYLVGFSCFALAAITYIMIWIVPRYQRIFDDFHTTLPPVTATVTQAAYTFVHFWELPFLGLLAMLVATVYAIARYTGLLRWEAPLLRRFSLPLDQALVLRSLAQSVEQGTTIDSALSWLAKRYPKEHVRDRLRTALALTSGGTHWCDSLEESKLVPRAEAGVLKAAERVGNLAWAMNDSADRLTRRFTNRLTAVNSIVFPMVLLVFAAVVFFVAVGMIMPLAKLVSALSSAR